MKKHLRERLREDESGMAMALAVIMIALLGVMGAGLLVFATTDLNTVVENNRGQRAFEMADAGIEAAKQQLASDSTADHYNGGTGDIQWSYEAPTNPDGMTLTDLDGSSTTTDRVSVTIQSLGNGAFKVLSTGQYGVAKRRVEAVFAIAGASESDGVPSQLQDFHTNGDFVVRGETTLRNTMAYVAGETDIASTLNLNNSTIFSEEEVFVNPMINLVNASVFSRANFNNNNGWSNPNVSGEDPFGNWYNPPFNTIARPTSASGIGVNGTIIKPQYSTPLNGYNDTGGFPQQHFDSTANSDPKFGSGITFPFDPEALAGTEPNIDELREIAKSQSNFSGQDDNYIEIGASSSIRNVGLGNNGYSGDLGLAWPDDTTLGTVVFISFKGGDANNEVFWAEYGSCSDTPREAIIVVENADFHWTAGSPLDGAIIAKSGSQSEGKIDVNGNLCTSGPIFADGTIAIEGGGNNTFPLDPDETGQIPGMPGSDDGGVQLRSWREVYE